MLSRPCQSLAASDNQDWPRKHATHRMDRNLSGPAQKFKLLTGVPCFRGRVNPWLQVTTRIGRESMPPTAWNVTKRSRYTENDDAAQSSLACFCRNAGGAAVGCRRPRLGRSAFR